jgi:hypothetical protein
MGRTACTEPQCLYKGALYLYLYRQFFRKIVKKEYQMGTRKFCQANVEEREQCNDLVVDGRLTSTCNYTFGWE